MPNLHGYPKIINFGHRIAAGIVGREVVAEEKIDGSSFSFGVREGQLFCRSKGKQIEEDSIDKMFRGACDTAASLVSQLTEGYTYRAEAVASRKHNTLNYDRVPRGNLVLFDVDKGRYDHMSYTEKDTEARRLGLEVVPYLYEGVLDVEQFGKLLETESMLGGPKIEGVVLKPIKPYFVDLFGGEPKPLMLKFVSEAFKEIHKGDWKSRNGSQRDRINIVMAKFGTEQRWEKAVQHMRDDGLLTNSPKDIGSLIREVQTDVLSGPDRTELADAILKIFDREIGKGLIAGLAEWYKAKLVDQTFEIAAEESNVS